MINQILKKALALLLMLNLALPQTNSFADNQQIDQDGHGNLTPVVALAEQEPATPVKKLGDAPRVDLFEAGALEPVRGLTLEGALNLVNEIKTSLPEGYSLVGDSEDMHMNPNDTTIGFNLLRQAGNAFQTVARITLNHSDDQYRLQSVSFMGREIPLSNLVVLADSSIQITEDRADELTRQAFQSLSTLTRIDEDDIRLNPNVIIIKGTEESVEAANKTLAAKDISLKIESGSILCTRSMPPVCSGSKETSYFSAQGVLMGSKTEQVARNIRTIVWKDAQGEIIPEPISAALNDLKKTLGESYAVRLEHLPTGELLLKIDFLSSMVIGMGIGTNPDLKPGKLSSLRATITVSAKGVVSLNDISASFKNTETPNDFIRSYLAQLKSPLEGIKQLAIAKSENSPQGTLYLTHIDGTVDRIAKFNQASNSRIIATTLNAAEFAAVRELENNLPADMQVRTMRQENGTLRVLVGAPNLGQGTALPGDFSNLYFTIKNDGSLDMSTFGAAYNSGYNYRVSAMTLFDAIRGMQATIMSCPPNSENCVMPRLDLRALADMAQMRIVIFNMSGLESVQFMQYGGPQSIIGFTLKGQGYHLQMSNGQPQITSAPNLPAFTAYLDQMQKNLGSDYMLVASGWSADKGYEVSFFPGVRRRVVINDGSIHNLIFHVNFTTGEPQIDSSSMTFQSANGLLLAPETRSRFVQSISRAHSDVEGLELIRTVLATKISDYWLGETESATTENFLFVSNGKEFLVSYITGRGAPNPDFSIQITAEPSKKAVEDLIASIRSQIPQGWIVTQNKDKNGAIFYSLMRDPALNWPRFDPEGVFLSATFSATYSRGQTTIDKITPVFNAEETKSLGGMMIDALSKINQGDLVAVMAQLPSVRINTMDNIVEPIRPVRPGQRDIGERVRPVLRPSRPYTMITFTIGQVQYQYSSRTRSVTEISRVVAFGSAATAMGMSEAAIEILRGQILPNRSLPTIVTYFSREKKIEWMDENGITWTVVKEESANSVSFRVDRSISNDVFLQKVQHAFATSSQPIEDSIKAETLALLANAPSRLSLSPESVPTYLTVTWPAEDGFVQKLSLHENGATMNEQGVMIPSFAIYMVQEKSLSYQEVLSKIDSLKNQMSPENAAELKVILDNLAATIAAGGATPTFTLQKSNGGSGESLSWNETITAYHTRGHYVESSEVAASYYSIDTKTRHRPDIGTPPVAPEVVGGIPPVNPEDAPGVARECAPGTECARPQDQIKPIEDGVAAIPEVVLTPEQPAKIPQLLNLEKVTVPITKINDFFNENKISGLNDENRARIINAIRLANPDEFSWSKLGQDNRFRFEIGSFWHIITLRSTGEVIIDVQDLSRAMIHPHPHLIDKINLQEALVPEIGRDEAIAVVAQKTPERRMETFRPEDAERACLPGTACAAKKKAKMLV